MIDRNISKKQEEWLKLNFRDRTNAELAKRLKTDEHTIAYYARKHGLRKSKQHITKIRKEAGIKANCKSCKI